jgi:hypothetical protein
VTWADFEEKEYELAASIELAESPGPGRGVVLSPGQVLEEIVGYDAATHPTEDHVIWRLLRLPRPAGVRLVPTMWQPKSRPPADRLPGSLISFIVQYKRPEYLVGYAAAQWRMWRRPYFRFSQQYEQQKVLARLERTLGDDAIVRYASPAFWQVRQLEAAHLNRTVLAQTGFVAPSALTGHKVWTYVRPGLDGKANPNGSEQPFPSFWDLWGQAFEPTTTGTDLLRVRTLESTLTRAGEVAVDRQPALRRKIERWTRTLDLAIAGERLVLSPAQRQQVIGLAAMVSLTSSIGATWSLISRPSIDPTETFAYARTQR